MNVRMTIAGALSVALVLALVPGAVLAQDEAGGSPSPEDVEWTLTTLSGAPVADGVEVTLFLSGGEVAGNAGCNQYFGSYELDGDALTFPDALGATLKLCDESVMAVEDAYLPLLQTTATWAIDAEGALSLADADGVVQLVYGEAPIDITASDLYALVSTLGALQAQIAAADAEIALLSEAAASVDVAGFDERLGTLEEKVGGANVVNIRRRVEALEETVDRLDRTVGRFSDRIAELERSSRQQNRRINRLEEAVGEPTP